jgi:putative membrane protein
VASDKTSASTVVTSGRTDLEIRDMRLANDRMLMDWVRTGISMISFGFTIYMVLSGLRERPDAPSTHPLAQQFSPRNIGLFLCGVGTLSIVMGTIEYVNALRQMGLRPARHTWRPAFILALLLSAAGLFVSLSMLSSLF